MIFEKLFFCYCCAYVHHYSDDAINEKSSCSLRRLIILLTAIEIKRGCEWLQLLIANQTTYQIISLEHVNDWNQFRCFETFYWADDFVENIWWFEWVLLQSNLLLWNEICYQSGIECNVLSKHSLIRWSFPKQLCVRFFRGKMWFSAKIIMSHQYATKCFIRYDLFLPDFAFSWLWTFLQ